MLTYNGEPLPAYEGETVAAALFAHAIYAGRLSSGVEEQRGYYCGMGICWDCVMIVDGRRSIRTCRVMVADGMTLETQRDR